MEPTHWQPGSVEHKILTLLVQVWPTSCRARHFHPIVARFPLSTPLPVSCTCARAQLRLTVVPSRLPVCFLLRRVFLGVCPPYPPQPWAGFVCFQRAASHGAGYLDLQCISRVCACLRVCSDSRACACVEVCAACVCGVPATENQHTLFDSLSYRALKHTHLNSHLLQPHVT